MIKQTTTAPVLITKLYKESVIYMQNAQQSQDNEKQWCTDPLLTTLSSDRKRNILSSQKGQSPFPLAPGNNETWYWITLGSWPHPLQLSWTGTVKKSFHVVLKLWWTCAFCPFASLLSFLQFIFSFGLVTHISFFWFLRCPSEIKKPRVFSFIIAVSILDCEIIVLAHIVKHSLSSLSYHSHFFNLFFPSWFIM